MEVGVEDQRRSVGECLERWAKSLGLQGAVALYSGTSRVKNSMSVQTLLQQPGALFLSQFEHEEPAGLCLC